MRPNLIELRGLTGYIYLYLNVLEKDLKTRAESGDANGLRQVVLQNTKYVGKGQGDRAFHVMANRGKAPVYKYFKDLL